MKLILKPLMFVAVHGQSNKKESENNREISEVVAVFEQSNLLKNENETNFETSYS